MSSRARLLLGGIVAGVLLGAWLLSGLTSVGSSERAVLLAFGRVTSTAGPGLTYAWPWPIGEVRTTTVTEVRRLEVGMRLRGELYREARRTDTLTGDENILKVMLVVQYRVTDPVAYLLASEDPDWLVERAVEAAMNRSIAGMRVDDVLTTAKAEVERAAIEQAQQDLNGYGLGIRLVGANLQTVSPPVAVLEAFNDVARAKKDNERLIEMARSYANELLPRHRATADERTSSALARADAHVRRARGEVDRFGSLRVEDARDPQLTRQRLYLEMLERVLGEAEVMVVDDETKIHLLER